MAFVGVRGQKCPKCGSTLTDEVQKHPKETYSIYEIRDIYLRCFDCGTDTYIGRYKKVGHALVRE